MWEALHSHDRANELYLLYQSESLQGRGQAHFDLQQFEPAAADLTRALTGLQELERNGKLPSSSKPEIAKLERQIADCLSRRKKAAAYLLPSSCRIQARARRNSRFTVASEIPSASPASS